MNGPLYRPSELLEFLRGLGIEPRKGLSQNFLVDGNIIRKIVTTANVQKDDPVLEIGPGPGALTQALLQAGAQVLACEQDQVLAEQLLRLQCEERLRVRQQDIRCFDLDAELSPGTKVVANLPYHLSTPILAMLLPRRDLLGSITVMVQEEMARRIVAGPGTKDYGSLSVFVRFFGKASYAFKVSRGCFYPAPKVDSAVVHIKLEQAPAVDEDAFFVLTRGAFAQRRKMLRTSLKEIYGRERLDKAFVAASIDGTSRPEQLSLEDFLRLFAALHEDA